MTKKLNPAAVITLLYVIFILYSTTLPYDLTVDADIISANVRSIRWIPFIRLDGTRESIPDVASNVLLFIPLGALLAYSACPSGKRRSSLSRLLMAVFASGLLSLLVESIQIFSISRITSLTDLVNNSFGGLCGAILFVLFSSKFTEPLSRWSLRNVRTSPEVILLAVYALLMLASFSIPFDISLDVSSIKQGLKSARWDPMTDPTSPLKMVGNFLWLSGFAFLLCRLWSRRFFSGRLLPVIAALSCSTLLAVILEILQVFLVSRVAATRDLLAGLAGCAYGGALFVALGLLFPTRAEDLAAPERDALQNKVLLALVWAHYLIYLIHMALFPYAFRLPVSLWQAIRSALVPFGSYYGQTDVTALFDFLGGLARFAPLGFLVQKQDPSSPGGRPWLSIVASSCLGFILEGFQLGTLGRCADISDVMAAGCGGYAGFLVWRWWSEKRDQKRGVEDGESINTSR